MSIRPGMLRLLSSRAWVAALLLSASLLVYLGDRSFSATNDARPNAYLPASLLKDGDLVFSPFEAPFMFLWQIDAPPGKVPAQVPAWNLRPAGAGPSYAQLYAAGRLDFVRPKYYLVQTGRFRDSTGEPLFASTFGPAAGLAGLPAAAVAVLLGAELRDHETVWLLARISAALLVAGSVALVYLSAAAFTSSARAAVLAGAYALGTCVWPISSQTLWQQTPTLFLLALGAWCLVRGEGTWVRGLAAGLALSAAAACRPTAALVLAVALGYLWISDRRAFLAGVLGALPACIAVAAYNAHYFGSPLTFGQLAGGGELALAKTGSPELWQTPLWLGAAGLLLSPSRGLLVHSPFLAAAFAGAVRAWRDPRYSRLRFLTVAVPLLWLPAFAWFDWWGGWTWGYRPIVDSAPLLALLCVPVLDAILDRAAWRAAFAAALAWSVLVQAVGALAYTPYSWNAMATGADSRADIDRPEHRHRLWSFRDWQIGFFLAEFSATRAERLAMSQDWVRNPTR